MTAEVHESTLQMVVAGCPIHMQSQHRLSASEKAPGGTALQRRPQVGDFAAPIDFTVFRGSGKTIQLP